MRIAIVSDIHGNLTAFEAVLADLRQTAPDLILHGGDLADGGANPAAILDQIRDLAWPGVLGNTDEMLFAPETLEVFANNPPRLPALFAAIREMAAATRHSLGLERVAWLRELPRIHLQGKLALVHASPDTTWSAPAHNAVDDDLRAPYHPLNQPLVVYGHIHHPFIRRLPEMTVANAGSVSLSYDGDRRASYLLLDDLAPAIRRVEYDVDTELKALSNSTIPHAGWIARMLSTASPQMP
jgi:putative phosphoesterase